MGFSTSYNNIINALSTQFIAEHMAKIIKKYIRTKLDQILVNTFNEVYT
jgi:hypothetical protein